MSDYKWKFFSDESFSKLSQKSQFVFFSKYFLFGFFVIVVEFIGLSTYALLIPEFRGWPCN